MEPLISVVIPTRTSEYKMKDALDAMINQTYKNLEILVIDDHGANATKSIVEEYTSRDPRVQYHLNPNLHTKRKNWRGYDINAGWSARAYGFRIAKGEWITTQDADDASLLNRIEVQYDFAKRYNATLVTVSWAPMSPESLGKKLDIGRLIKERGEEHILIRPEEIAALAKANRGILMQESFHKFIPFPIKWFPYTRKLFYPRNDIYPGADNCMFFHRNVIEAGINFRMRDERTWGTPSGRGSGRDFVFRVASKFKNSYSLKLPLYLWNVKTPNSDYPDFEKYLV